jgi:hypothetical protein
MIMVITTDKHNERLAVMLAKVSRIKTVINLWQTKQYIDCERTGSCNSGAVAYFIQCSASSFNGNIHVQDL